MGSSLSNAVSKQVPKLIDLYADFDWEAPPGQCTEYVKCYAFAESPGGEGLQCVISDPLDKYMTKQQLWDALIRWRRVPMRDPACTEMEVTEEPDGTIVLKKTLDMSQVAETFTGLVRKVDGTDPTRICKTVIDHEKFWMNRNTYYGDGRTHALNRDFMQIWDDPLVLEVWRIDLANGLRECNESVRDVMEKVLNIIVKMDGQLCPDFEMIDQLWKKSEALEVLCW